jgi:hypothetical protein
VLVVPLARLIVDDLRHHASEDDAKLSLVPPYIPIHSTKDKSRSSIERSKVRMAPSWTRNWANFSRFIAVFPLRNAWANLHLLANLTPFSLSPRSRAAAPP